MSTMEVRLHVVFCLCVCLLISSAEVIHDVTVTTKYGEILGQRHKNNYDIGEGVITDSVDVFLGIPYAAPPTGSLRFRSPQTPASWEGVLDATKPGPVCPQKVYYTQTAESSQSEDCLNLNIYSPVGTDHVTDYPVMLFVHGGSYEEGAGSRYNGFTLAQHGVVVVTINYRLGALGFFTNGMSSLPGNYGLEDQIEALRWVSQNIGNFRGQACSVTLFGSSAGSSSIGLLVLSPLTRGLFNRVILQSGSPTAYWAVYDESVNHEQFFDDVCTVVGCDRDSTDDKIQCLRELHFSNFTDNHWNFPRIVPSNLNFKPRVDGDILPNRPRDMFLSGPIQNLTLMVGTLQDEWARSMGWFFNDMDNPDPNLKDGMDRDAYERSIEHVFMNRFSWPAEVARAASFMYTDWTNETDPYINRDGYKNLMSDFLMVAPSIELADILAEKGTTVYYYNYNHTSALTDSAWWGSYHSIELDSVFGSAFNGFNIAADCFCNHTEADKEFSRVVMHLWTNFAKTGNPTPEPVHHVIWQHMDASLNNYLHISAPEVVMRSHLRADKMAFWNKLVPSLLELELGRNEKSLSKAADKTLTLMWFFGILSVLSFAVTLAIVVRNGSLQKKLNKAVLLSNQEPL